MDLNTLHYKAEFDKQNFGKVMHGFVGHVHNNIFVIS